MECEINADYSGIADTPALFREYKRRARKNHKCDECDVVIHAAEIYEDVVMLCDGEWTQHKTCPACLEVRNAIFCNSWLYGAVWASA